VRRWEERGVCVIACSQSPPRGPLCARPRRPATPTPRLYPRRHPASPRRRPVGVRLRSVCRPALGPPPTARSGPCPAASPARSCAAPPWYAERRPARPHAASVLGVAPLAAVRAPSPPRRPSLCAGPRRCAVGVRLRSVCRSAIGPLHRVGGGGSWEGGGTAVKQGQNGAADGVWRTRWRHSAMISSHRAGV
jgi:hypothetical protein